MVVRPATKCQPSSGAKVTVAAQGSRKMGEEDWESGGSVFFCNEGYA
jgi:hypothetical protein